MEVSCPSKGKEGKGRARQLLNGVSCLTSHLQVSWYPRPLKAVIKGT